MTSDEVHNLAAELLPAIEELLSERRQPPPIVTADDLAKYLKVSREVIYANADQLGAIRIGDGPRPRLRFRLDGDQVRAWQAGKPMPSRSDESRPRRRRPSKRIAADNLLPVRGR